MSGWLPAGSDISDREEYLPDPEAGIPANWPESSIDYDSEACLKWIESWGREDAPVKAAA